MDTDNSIAPIFSRAAFRRDRRLVMWLALSLLVCVVELLWNKSYAGDFTGGYTDHVHHARATWAFLNHGLDAYKRPLLETSVNIGYAQSGMTWETYPVAYPPGMFVAFLLPAILGRIYTGPEAVFGKFVIFELTLITHAALWALAPVFRRVASHFWTGVLVLSWIFLVRITLMGFYDGAWLLAGALGVDYLARRRPGPALACFVIANLTSYRAAGFAVLALYALIELLRGDARRVVKIAYLVGTAVSAAVVVWSFAMLVKYSPHDGGAGSPLLPLKFTGIWLLVFGLLTGALLAVRVSKLVGLSVMLASALSILHAGHHWHVCICIPSLLALALARQKPLWAQLLMAFWFLVLMRYAFSYGPFGMMDEVLKFIELNGRPVR